MWRKYYIFVVLSGLATQDGIVGPIATARFQLQ